MLTGGKTGRVRGARRERETGGKRDQHVSADQITRINIWSASWYRESKCLEIFDPPPSLVPYLTRMSEVSGLRKLTIPISLFHKRTWQRLVFSFLIAIWQQSCIIYILIWFSFSRWLIWNKFWQLPIEGWQLQGGGAQKTGWQGSGQ